MGRVGDQGMVCLLVAAAAAVPAVPAQPGARFQAPASRQSAHWQLQPFAAPSADGRENVPMLAVAARMAAMAAAYRETSAEKCCLTSFTRVPPAAAPLTIMPGAPGTPAGTILYHGTGGGMPDTPVLYLMSPMTLYWTPALAAARQYPFATLTGCPVRVECAEGMFPDTRSWAAAWPSLRHRYAFGVFLDCNGWVSRGVWAEACDLASLGKPVWWLNDAQPVRRFGFGPARNKDWARYYRRVYALPAPGEEADDGDPAGKPPGVGEDPEAG